MLGGLAGILAIILFVTAHEAGHFFAAKATGMKATEFFFGFGPKLWSIKRGETEYGFKLIPFGGYVRIIGMSPFDEVPPEEEHRTYRGKPFWQKSVVVLAGVMMNFFLAFAIFFTLIVIEDIPEPSTTVRAVVEELDDGTPSPAAEAGLQPGDTIVSVDGVSTPGWDEVAAALASQPGEAVELGVIRDGETIEVPVTLAAVEGVDGDVGFLGVGPEFTTREAGFFEAIGIAAEEVWRGSVLAIQIFGNLIRPDSLATLAGGLVGQEVPDEIRPVSPIGLAGIGAQADEIGISRYVALLASVNIILGILNVLPLYPLDGGHFAVALYEKVTGRRVDFRKLAPIAAMVVALIAFLGIVAIVLDIIDPIDL